MHVCSRWTPRIDYLDLNYSDDLLWCCCMNTVCYGKIVFTPNPLQSIPRLLIAPNVILKVNSYWLLATFWQTMGAKLASSCHPQSQFLLAAGNSLTTNGTPGSHLTRDRQQNIENYRKKNDLFGTQYTLVSKEMEKKYEAYKLAKSIFILCFLPNTWKSGKCRKSQLFVQWNYIRCVH